MKKLILGTLLILGVSTNALAFESGTYTCKHFIGDIIITLKDNGRATVKGLETERGNWQDDDDAAIIITTDNVLVDKGNGKYVLNDLVGCEKTK